MIDVPNKVDPQYLDKAIEVLNTKIAELDWMTQAFGKIEKLIKDEKPKQGSIMGSQGTRYPAIYRGGGSKEEYEDMFPDEGKGNFSYIEVIGGSEPVKHYRTSHDLVQKIGIVFWFDFRTVYPDDYVNRTIENVKSEVLNKLTERMGLHMKILRVVEGADNIYRGFHHNEITRQFLMRPYGGFKVIIELKQKNLC